jgi:heme oxygenase (biliverdin-IX-beta and delta-forming)
MQVAGPPTEPGRVEESRHGGLRDRLKEATASAHHDLDAQFAAFDLTARNGYRRFLEASAAALLPLEAALERAGVARLFSDWPTRSRRDAITTDLVRLGGNIHPMDEVAPLRDNAVFGTMYVLEGSRLGAKYLLRMMSQSTDPLIAEARAYLGHGAGQPLWRSFLARLECEALSGEAEAEAIAGARRAFAMFAEAAARA